MTAAEPATVESTDETNNLEVAMEPAWVHDAGGSLGPAIEAELERRGS